jgi:multisubunit Na+/H+ antiporter MnhG subunit
MNRIKDILEKLDYEDKLVIKGVSYCLIAIGLLFIAMNI